jgi:uncharacterized protein YdhG (YjbR/CyaY superfamily)
MPERKPARARDPQSAEKSTSGTADVFTAEERAAMADRVRESKASGRRRPGGTEADGERDVLSKIAEMPERERDMAERLHAIVKSCAPTLSARTWYGMPAYSRDGDVVCFFQAAQKFKARYSTFGFTDKANLDDGSMWPTSFALNELTAAGEAAIASLVKKAAT